MEELDQITSTCESNFLISEKSKWKGFFDIMMLFVSVYSTFTAAFYACFGDTTKRSYATIGIIVELLFLTDMVLTFF